MSSYCLAGLLPSWNDAWILSLILLPHLAKCTQTESWAKISGTESSTATNALIIWIQGIPFPPSSKPKGNVPFRWYWFTCKSFLHNAARVGSKSWVICSQALRTIARLFLNSVDFKSHTEYSQMLGDWELMAWVLVSLLLQVHLSGTVQRVEAFRKQDSQDLQVSHQTPKGQNLSVICVKYAQNLTPHWA